MGLLPGWAAIKLPRSIQPSITPGYVHGVPAWLAGVKAGHVHLCRVAGNTDDPIWQVTSRSSEMDSHEELYAPLTFFNRHLPWYIVPEQLIELIIKHSYKNSALQLSCWVYRSAGSSVKLICPRREGASNLCIRSGVSTVVISWFWLNVPEQFIEFIIKHSYKNSALQLSHWVSSNHNKHISASITDATHHQQPVRHN